MTAPRLEIDLDKIGHNADALVGRLAKRGLSVTGVTKAFLGLPAIARTLLKAGVSGLADSRIETIEAMRFAGIEAQMSLIRSPMLSQADQVVTHADISFNTEIDVVAALSSAAGKLGREHGIVLMVELGDLREGIMPADLDQVVRRTLRLPHIALKGIGANLACRCGVTPDHANMAELSALADRTDRIFGRTIGVVSGGNSANLHWALGGADTGRINNLRLGESILLGRETLHRQPIEGLHTDAITLVAEVIEAKIKPSQPWGDVAQSAFGPAPANRNSRTIAQAILAIGHTDTDPAGLTAPPGIEILGSSSDHLVVDTGPNRLAVGAEITFQPNYSALIRAMASPFVDKAVLGQRHDDTRDRRYSLVQRTPNLLQMPLDGAA